MQEILFLLLPLAFYSGWNAARKRNKQQEASQTAGSSPQFVRGINFLLNEEPDKALDAFLQSPAIDNQTAETFLSLGNMFRNRGEVNRALRVHQHLVARSDLDQQQRQTAMLALGKDFFAAGMLDRAERVFREIVDKYPENTQATEPLRHIYEQLQEWDKAIALTERSQQSSQDKHHFIAHYYCEKASTDLQENRLYKAGESLKKAQLAHIDSSRVKVLQAELALARQEYDSATVHFRNAMESNPRLPGMLAPRLLKLYPEQTDQKKWYQFLQQQYEKHHDNTLFPVLLEFAHHSGTSAELQTLIQSHLQDKPATLQTITRSLKTLQEQNVPAASILAALTQALEKLAKEEARFRCEQCGYKMQDYLWRCPACRHWDSVINH